MAPFKTFSESALAILAFALGEMRTNMILTQYLLVGPIYLILITFLLIFVFQNMFFVILSYNYEAVRQERSQLSRGLNVLAFLRNGLLNLRRRLRWEAQAKGHAPDPDPQEYMESRLVRCGFSPGSLQVFKATLQPRQNQVRSAQ